MCYKHVRLAGVCGEEVEICNRILQFDFPAVYSVLQITKAYVSGL